MDVVVVNDQSGVKFSRWRACVWRTGVRIIRKSESDSGDALRFQHACSTVTRDSNL